MGLSYQSPIEVIQTQMRNQIEGEIYKVVMNVGVNVDKEELLKALQYDREQYQKGYKDRDEEIVRCQDCKHLEHLPWLDDENGRAVICRKHTFTGLRSDNWFCADGERKEGR